MKKKQLFTAIGRFEQKTNKAGSSIPVIILGGKEYILDYQELLLWSCLNWRIVRMNEIDELYNKACSGNVFLEERTMDICMSRLLTRGLIVFGTGETDYDALYDLLSSMYIVPTGKGMLLRLFTFGKLLLFGNTSVSEAKKLLIRDTRTDREEQVMKLTGQALLSSAEIIKCVEKGIYRLPDEESIVALLYDDEETTCDNISYLVKAAPSSKAVILAIANLYLRQQIIFERI